MSKHTKGPWEYSEEDGEPVVMAGDYYVATAHIGVPGGNSGIDAAKDNARLIAAAPDLLEALKFIRSVARFAHFPEADAAIAKAEGRS